MTRDAVTSDQLPASGLPFSVAGSWATCPDKKSSPPPRTAAENGRPDAGSWSLVTASRVMVGEFLSLMCWAVGFFRQGYRDASTRPSAAGVTGILDPRRDPDCCAASRVDRLG